FGCGKKKDLRRAVGFLAAHLPNPHCRDFLARALFENKNSIWLEEFWQSLLGQKLVGKTFTGFRFLIRWIGKDNSEFFAGRSSIFQEPKNICFPSTPRKLRFRQVFFNRTDGFSIFLNKKG